MATKISLYSKESNAQNRYNISPDSNDNEIADINTKERENIKDIEQYHNYQQDTQNNTPWASSSVMFALLVQTSYQTLILLWIRKDVLNVEMSKLTGG